MNRLIEAVILRAARQCFAATALDEARRSAKAAEARLRAGEQEHS